MTTTRAEQAGRLATNSTKLQASLKTTANMNIGDRNVWLTAKYRGDSDLQAEFASEGEYLAYMEAARTGRTSHPNSSGPVQ